MSTIEDNECSFHIQTVQSGAFRILIEALKEILTDTNLIIDNTGKHLGTINPGSRVANCAFDKKEDFLYMTSDNNLTRIKINYDPLSY